MAKKRQPQTQETYIVELENSECDYSIGLNLMKNKLGAYSEYCHPKISGKIIRPDLKSIPTAKITLIANRHMDEELSERNTFRHEPVAVGHLETRSGELQGSMSIPFSAIGMIMQGIATGQIRYVTMHGSKLRYRQTLITSIGFIKDYDPVMYE